MERKGLFSSLFFLVLLTANASAGFFSDDIIFSTPQKDYYFLVGEEAGIIFNTSNDLDHSVTGTITYTVDGPGTHNSQSATFTVQDAKNSSGISFGTSDTPLSLTLEIRFEFEDQYVIIDSIGIHFVKQEEEKQNEQDKQKSSQEKNKQKSQEQKPQEQQPQQQSTQQKAANNQAPQSGQEMKQNMQRDAQRAQQAKEEFMEELQKNEELQKEHEQLQKEGFQQTGGDIRPKVNDSSSGKFELNYKDSQGNEATLSGKMENGTVTDLKKTNTADLKKLQDLVRADPRFQKLNEKLSKDNYQEKNVNYRDKENSSIVNFNYTDEFGNVESIIATVKENIVTQVYLDKDKNWFWLWGFLAIPVALVSAYLLKKKRKIISIDEPIIKTKRFDYKKESRNLLRKSEQEFEKKNYKDAYGLANSAIRMFLSYKSGLNKELTNYEILNKIKTLPKETKETFDLCCLVEFAKYKPNKKDFTQIVNFANKLLYK